VVENIKLAVIAAPVAAAPSVPARSRQTISAKIPLMPSVVHATTGTC